MEYPLFSYSFGRNSSIREKLGDGQHQVYYPDGQVWHKYHIFNHMLHGEYNIYYPDGKLHKSIMFCYAELCGQYNVWYKSGLPREKSVFNAGNITGLSRLWNDDSHLLSGQLFYSRRMGRCLHLEFTRKMILLRLKDILKGRVRHRYKGHILRLFPKVLAEDIIACII
jgi:antitoxin component YwqK of YwqJK toxin-antitoxin module